MKSVIRPMIAVCSLGLLGLALSPSVSAQPETLVSKGELEQFEALSPLELEKLLTGAMPIGDKEKKDIALMAKYYVYFQTLPQHQKDEKVIERRNDFVNRILYQALKEDVRDKNKDVRVALAKEMISCFQTVFARDAVGEPRQTMKSCVNAAQLLPAFAQLDSPEIADFLIGLVRDNGKPPVAWAAALSGLAATPDNYGPILTAATFAPMRDYGKFDTVKIYAFKALQVYFAPRPKEMDFDFNGTGFLEKERRYKLAQRLNPIIDYILNPPYLKTKPEKDGYRFVRCEAIKALAQVPTPYVSDQPDAQKPGKIISPIAYTLLRVLANGDAGLSVEPSLQERAFAAMGLCHIDAKTKADENVVKGTRYKQELAPALIGMFLSDFLQEYQTDYPKFSDPNLKLPPRLPWKVFSKLLAESLNDAGPNFTSEQAQKAMKNIQAAVQDELVQIGAAKGTVNPVAIANVVRDLPPPNPVVYENSPYELKLTWPPN